MKKLIELVDVLAVTVLCLATLLVFVNAEIDMARLVGQSTPMTALESVAVSVLQ